jgi:hypothetical protein
MNTSFSRARDSIATDPQILSIPNIFGEQLKVWEEPHIVIDRDIDNSWIVGSPTNGLVGTNTATAGGGQQVVGNTNNAQALLRICPSQNIYVNFLRDTITNTLNRGYFARWHTGMDAHYKLDNNVLDSEGSFNGTATSITYNASGKLGYSAVFNGSSSRITLAASNSMITNNSAWSMAAWAKADTISASTNDNRIITFMRDAFSGTAAGIGFGGSNKIQLQYRNASATTVDRDIILTATTGVWYHVVVTYDGTSYRCYVNGELVLTEAATFAGFSTGTATIGSRGTANYFDGEIDDVRVYSSDTLNAKEVSVLYNSGRGVADIATFDTAANRIDIDLNEVIVWRLAEGSGSFYAAIPSFNTDGERTDIVFGTDVALEISADGTTWVALTNQSRTAFTPGSSVYFRMVGLTSAKFWKTANGSGFEAPIVIRLFPA